LFISADLSLNFRKPPAGGHRDEQSYITPPTGISPPYQRRTAVSPSATRSNSDKPIAQGGIIAVRFFAHDTLLVLSP
jgi:hypothetical protein